MNWFEKRMKELGYSGCRNCEHQIDVLRTCEWMEHGGDGVLHLICPRWEKRITEVTVRTGGTEMKVRDLLNMEIDIDVYDDVTEELGIAFCGPLYLTELGMEKFAEVLDYEIQIGNDCAIVCIDDADDKVWKRRLKRAKEFFESAAGYCDAGDWDAWFATVWDERTEAAQNRVSTTENSERSRTLTVTLQVEDGNAVAEFLEGETGEHLSVVLPYSPDEHPDFNEAVGNELYSWLELMMDEQEG